MVYINIFIILFIFLEQTLQKEYVVSKEFTSKTISSASGWTFTTVKTCSNTSFIDFSNSNYIGILAYSDVEQKGFSLLPPHWSLSVRFDLLLVSSLDPSDYVEILIDNISQNKYYKSSGDGTDFCYVESSFNDEIILYHKNVTHTASSVQININSHTDEGPTNEGYGFRNFFLYIDTCDYSCLSCSGPTSNQCVTCPANATKTGSTCACNSGYLSHQYSCVTTCPAGFKKENNSNVCISDYCLNCSSCNTTNQVCNTCNSGYYVYKGYCVTSCPFTSTLSGTTCVDFDSTLINGKYLISGLDSDQFGDSEIKGMGLVLGGFKGEKTSQGVSTASVTNCGSNHLLGGFMLSGMGSTISRSQTGLAPHWSIRIGITLWKLDSWDSESVILKVDSVAVKTWTQNYPDGSSNICGNSWNELAVPYVYNATHTSSSLSFDLSTTLNEDFINESYGIRELYILVDFCTPNCTSCNASGCITCQASYLMYYKKCYSPCPIGSYQNTSTTCADCNPTCQTCSAAAANNCTSCYTSNYLNPDNTCKTTCPATYWARSSDRTCQTCSSTSNCYTCQSPGDNNSCLSCSGSLYLYNNQCISTCPIRYYPNPGSQIQKIATNNNLCSACNSSCKTCDGPNINSCLSCDLPNYWQSSTKTCVSSCNSNQYGDTTLVQCISCHSSCTTCSGANSNNCLSCSGSLYFDSVAKTCVATCPNGTYANTTTHVCSNCDSTCTTCSGPNSTDCLSCTLPRYYQATTKTCTTSCNSNQYANSTSPPTCQNCESSCTTCSGTASNNCLSCSGSLYLATSGNTCGTTCLNTEYKNTSNNQCAPCNSNCYTCSGNLATNCLSCSSPNFYQSSSNTCVATCNSNQYSSTTPTRACNNCNASCATCSGPNSNNCLSCSGSTYLDTSTNTCVSTCPNGTYSNTTNHQCSPCNTDCTTCNGPNSNNCLTCTIPKYFQASSSQCVTSCNSNQYQDNPSVTCKSCYSTCTTCSGGANNNCLSCSGSLFLDRNTNTCVSTCPSSYYKNGTNNECTLCHTSCATCNGGTSNNCLSCTLPLYFQSTTSSCDSNCYLNQFKSPSPTPTCQPCNSSCATCLGPSTNECLSCSSPDYLQDPTQSSSSCLSLCPDGTYQNTSNQQCSKCDTTCKTCNNSASNNCLSCTLPRYFQPSTNSCVLVCNSNQYSDNSTATCRDCDSSCATCSESSANTKCLSCSGSLFFNANTRQCVSSCPDTYYKNTTNNTCTQCNSSCYLCDGGSANDCTSCQLPLYFQQSAKQCVSTCNSNQYKDTTLVQCMPCDTSCTTCSGQYANNCLSCSGSTYLNTSISTCVSICPNGTYPNLSTHTCSPCDTTCTTCNGNQNTSCLSCTLPRLYQSTSHECVTTCYSNQYADNSIPQCMDCHSSCTECNGPASNQCTKCSGILFLNPLTNECVSTCPSGYFKNITNNQCSICNSTCNNCDGPNSTDCLDCTLPRYYQSSTKSCVTNCNPNQYKDDVAVQCQQCSSQCATCSGPSNNQCTSCTGSTYLNISTNQCVSTCPDGQYKNTTNNICTSCENTCTTCTGGANNECITCSLPRYYQTSTTTCDLNCQTNQFKDNATATCILCESSCASCSGPNNNQCLSCSGSLFLDSTTNECVSTCPDSYYQNASDNTCQKCDTSCKTCNNKFDTSCLTCELPLYYHQTSSQCVSNCDSNQFKEDSTAKCVDCHASCKTCSGPTETECLSCPATTYLNLQQHNCQNNCPDGQYENDTNNQCTNCHTNCLTCSGGSSTDCLTCALPRYFQQSASSCDLTCNSNQYADSSDAECKSCQATCTTCSGPSNTECLSCSGTKFLYNNECIDTCPNGMYADSADHICKQCNTACKTCDGGSSSNCLSCNTATYLYSGQCLTVCPDKFFQNSSSQQCSPCSNMCGNCTDSNSTSCLSCPPGYLLQETTCVVNCSSQYFQDSNNLNCLKCDSSCQTCSNSTNKSCTSCSNPTYLLFGECIGTCPGGYYADNTDNTCKQCQSTCKTCSGGLSSQCTQCGTNRFLYNNICMTQCPDGYYNDTSSQLCSLCDSNCTTCNGASSSSCLTCSGALFLYENKCNSSCLNGFFKDKSNNKCTQCHSTCSTCTSFTDNSCLSCNSGSFLQQNTCVSSCNNGTYGDLITNMCQLCDPSCDTCSGPSISECQSCLGTKFYYQNQCIDTCPDGFFKNLTSNICTQCHSSCSTCMGDQNTQCLTCSSNLVLFNGQCLSQCPSGLYKSSITNSCEVCHKKCKDCSGPSEKECLSCNKGTILQEKQCLQQCTEGYYENNEKTQCSKCHDSCLTCSGPNLDQCETCPTLLLKYESKCITDCPHFTYLLETPIKQCFSCDETCVSECTGPAKQDCVTIKAQNQLIVYILTFKTLTWLLSVIIGLLKDQKNKDSSKAKIMPSTLTKLDLEDIEGDSPMNKKRADSPDNRMLGNTTLNVSPILDSPLKKGNPSQDSSPVPISSSFFPQQIDQQDQPIMTFQNEGNVSPDLSPRRNRRSRRTEFIMRPKGSNTMILSNLRSSQDSPSQSILHTNRTAVGSTSQVFDKLAPSGPTISSTIAMSSLFQNEAKNKGSLSDASEFKADQKLKFSFFGNEWLSLFSFYDSSITRVCRSTLIYMKYQMFFLICEHFSFSPLYYVIICLVTGLAMKFVLGNFLNLAARHSRHGNGLSMVLFLGTIGTELAVWFIPKIQSLNYSKDLNWSILYLITFAIDFLILQQILGLIQYLSSIRYLNQINPAKNINRLFKNSYMINKIKK